MVKFILWEVLIFLQIIFLHSKYYALFAFFYYKRKITEESEFLVINSVRSYIPAQLSIELKIALYSFLKGKEIVFLFDDNVLLTHDTYFKKYLPAQPKLVFYNFFFKFYRFLGIKIVFYSDFKQQLDEVNKENKDIVALKDYWLASATRFTKSLPDEKFIRSNFGDKLIDVFVENSKISYFIGLYVSTIFSKQILLTSHAIYSVWGAFALGYREGEKHYLCYGSNGYSSEKLDFALNAPAANKINTVELDRLLDASPSQLLDFREKARDTLAFRCASANQDQKRAGATFVNGLTPFIAKKLNNISGKKLVAIFPNVMWDNATSFSDLNTIFNNPCDWISALIRFAQDNPSFIIVIRCHPAEASFMSSGSSLYGLLSSNKLGPIPLNCIVIPPSDNSSSYDLIKMAHCVSVYNGTIGLEAIWLSKPLILAANAAYRCRGFTNDISSEVEYFDAIQRPENTLKIQEECFEKFLDFSYYYFHKTGKDIGALSKRHYFHPCLHLERKRASIVSNALEDLHEHYMQESIDRGTNA